MITDLRTVINKSLDRLARPQARVGRRYRSPLQVWCAIGLALSLGLTLPLATYLGLSPWVMAGGVLVALLALLGRMMLTDALLPNYHFQITAMIAVALLVWLLRQPVLLYLDVTVLGLGLSVACGRVGCLMGGCCHGRPYHLGVCYREAHAVASVAPHFVGVRLFPTQAVEALWVLLVVGIGLGMVLNGQAPGTTLAWYAMMYASARFGNEFLRAELYHPGWGFSEAQWTSVLVVIAVALAEWRGVLPWSLWHTVLAAGLVMTMIAVAVRRWLRQTMRHRLRYPQHIRELAEVIERLSGAAQAQGSAAPQRDRAAVIAVGCTSLGMQLSSGRIDAGDGCIEHYTFSARNGTLPEEDARALAQMLLLLTRHRGASELVAGKQGVFHVLLYPGTPVMGQHTTAQART